MVAVYTTTSVFSAGPVLHTVIFMLAGLVVVPADVGAWGIRDVAPYQLYPVSEVQVAPPVLLAPLPTESTQVYGVTPPEVAAETQGLDLFWQQDTFAAWQRSKVADPAVAKQAVWKRGPRRRVLSWLPRPTDDPWTFGASNWRYEGDQGLDFTLGNNAINVPAWSSSARMGGVSISQSAPVTDNTGAWHYSLAVGALDYTSAQESGDLVYGPTASNTVVRYGLSPQLTVETQLETAPGLVTTGLGGQYDTQGWGSLHAAFSRASFGQEPGWRYQTGYDVDIINDINLSWLHESHTVGYADLGHYNSGAASVAGTRSQVAATVPLGRWGDAGGIYENSRTSAGDIKRSFGFTQQLWYSPNLLIGIKAQREVVSGDYDIGLRLSVPLR